MIKVSTKPYIVISYNRNNRHMAVILMLATTKMNFKEEEILFNNFKNLYPEFPKGNVIHDDAPDFIVTHNNYSIGIELTEVFQDIDRNEYSKLKQDESLHNKIGNLLAEKLREFTDFDFHVTITFSDSFRMNGKKIYDMIKELLVVCAPELHHLRSIGHIRINNYRILPDGIHTIGLWYSPKFTYTTYLDSEGGMVSNFTDQHLNKILQDKERKIKNYKDCDEQWLLIKEGNFYAGSLDEILIEDKINTSFDLVFLFRTSTVGQKIFKLK